MSVELTEVVRRRRMVRRYTDAPVDPAALQRILNTTLGGPSAGYSQGLRLVVVTDAGRRHAIARLCGEEEHVAAGHDAWLSVAPVHVVLCMRTDDYRERYAEPDKAASAGPDQWDVPFWWIDAGAALMLLLLAAVDEGLGAGVLRIAAPDALRDLLAIPDDVTPVLLVTLGRPADDPGPLGSAARGRRPAGQVIHSEAWRQ